MDFFGARFKSQHSPRLRLHGADIQGLSAEESEMLEESFTEVEIKEAVFEGG